MSSESGPGLQVSSRLGYLFKHAGMRLAALYEEALGPFGVDARELGVLLLLAGHEPSSQQQAAKRLGVDRTTMVAVLDSLEVNGMVFRRADPEDRRRNVVGLTDLGQHTLREAVKASDAAEIALLAPLGGRAAQQLRDALQDIVTHGTDSSGD